MTRQKRLEKNGYRIIFDMNGSVFAKRGKFESVKGSSVTDLHRQIIGY